MADIAKTFVVGRDAVIGHRLGLGILAETSFVSRDVLWGARYGLKLLGETAVVHSETISGERVGRAISAEAAPVVIEYLIKDKFARTSVVHYEALISIVEPLKAPWRVPTEVEVVMQAATRADPPTVWSDTKVGSYREAVLQQRISPDMRSQLRASIEREQVTQRRTTIPAPDVRSLTRIGSYCELVLRSRDIATVKVSAVYNASYEERTVQLRTTLGVLRSPIRVSTERELVMMSRLAAPPTLIDDQAATLRELTTQARTITTPFSFDRAATLREQIVMQRLPSDTVNEFVSIVREQALQLRVTLAYIGTIPVAQLREQVLQGRTPIAPLSATYVGVERELVMMHREVALPGYLLGWSARTTVEVTTQLRVTLGVLHSPIQVGSERVQYTMFRTTVPPIDVISPEVGRHVGELRQQSVTLREVESPAAIFGKIRIVTHTGEQPVVRDASFPPPPIFEPDPVQVHAASVAAQAVTGETEAWIAVSRAIVPSVAQAAALEDAAEWIDPTLPQSDAEVMTALTHAAVLDPSFLGSDVPQSDVSVFVARQDVAVGDESFPPTSVPQSIPNVFHVAQQAAVGDASMTGVEPQSEVTVEHIEQPVVQRDLTMAGPLPTSPIEVVLLAHAVVLRDVTLDRIPVRPRGPRPSVSVMRC